MAGLIKNQIVKHLSKFVKNLNPDQISVEILRGKGELQHLILNEAVLTDALELPAWIRIQKAICNRVAVRVPWTRLKSSPIKLFIDELQVEIAMTSELRVENVTQATTISSLRASADNSYGFANRAVEGMSLYINTLEIRFTSEMFNGSVMLSRLSVESRSPAWHAVQDLRHTRISDHESGRVLLFKQIAWQLLRIEASAVGSGEERENKEAAYYHISAPLRLITSQGRCRLVVKKSTQDGSVLTGRIQIILDDILWVVTLPQIRSAISFYSYVMGLIKRADESSKAERAEKLLHNQVAVSSQFGSAMTGAVQRSPGGTLKVRSSSAFRQYDVVETSYHFYVGQVDLHLCDDSSSDIVFPDNWDIDNGALQITMRKLACDVYPYHLAAGERSYWIRYKDVDCKKWIDELLDHYETAIASKLSPKRRSELGNVWPKLMSQCFVVRVDELVVHCVSETGSKRGTIEKMISADREILTLPGDQPMVHLELVDYYYPGSVDLPVPPSSKIMCLAPVRVFVDYRTIRWAHFIYQDIVKTLGLKPENIETVPHSDIRIEAIMPRVILPAPTKEHIRQPKKPSDVRLNLSTCLITNCLVGDRIKTDSLKTAVRDLEERTIFCHSLSVGGVPFVCVPTETETFRNYLSQLCESLHIVQGFDNSGGKFGVDGQENNLKEHDFVIPPAVSDLYYVRMSPAWVEFSGTPIYYPRPMPFMLDVPVNLWLVNNFLGNSTVPQSSDVEEKAHVYCIAQAEHGIKIAINHFQYLYIMHATDGLSKFMLQLSSDAKLFGEAMDPKALAFAGIFSDVELNLILPVQPPISPYEETSPPVQNRTPTPENEVRDGYLHDGRSTPSTMREDTDSPIPTSLPATDKKLRGRTTETEEFPMFPTNDSDTDLMSLGREDELSIATDASDDDQFVLLDTPEGATFDDVFPEEIQGRIAVAEEAVENPRSEKHLELVQRILGEKVSIVCLRLKDVETLLACFNGHSRVKLQTHGLSATEWNNVTLDAVIQRLNSKKPTVQTDGEHPVCGKSSCEIPTEMEIFSVGPDTPGLMRGRVQGVSLKINNTNLANLTSFLEDDSDESGMSVRIRVKDSTLQIQSDNKDTVTLNMENSTVSIGEVDLESPTEDQKDSVANSVLGKASKLSLLQEENAELRRKLEEARALIVKLARDSYNVTLR